MASRAHVIISGSVKGVFFRGTIRSMAKMLKLAGWAKNTADGKVEAVFEGEKEDIDQVLEFCKKGPPGAAVDTTIVKWERPAGRLEGFEIKSAFSEPEGKEETAEEIRAEEIYTAAPVEPPAEEKEEKESGGEMVPKKREKKTFVVEGEVLEEEGPEW